MKKVIECLKSESGLIHLRGGCAVAAFIAAGVGLIIGIILGFITGDWYIAYICGSFVVINLIINFIRFIINRIKIKITFSPKIIRWLKEEKGLSDLQIKYEYLGNDLESSIFRGIAKEEYKRYLKEKKLKK
jgi:hypothetical protein